MLKQKRKQLSMDFIDYTKKCVNDLLATNMPQSSKYKLCILMEKLLRDIKQKAEYKHLYWQKYGKLDWDAEKQTHLAKLSLGDTIKVPKSYIVGPDATDDPNFISDIQGEFSRSYL